MEKYIGIGKLSFIPLSDLAKEIPIPNHHFLIQKDDYGFEVIATETGLLASDTKSVFKAIKLLADMIVHYTVKNTFINGKEKFERISAKLDHEEYKKKYQELKALYDSKKKKRERRSKNFKLESFKSNANYSIPELKSVA